MTVQDSGKAIALVPTGLSREYVDCLAGNVSADGCYDQYTVDHEDAIAVCPQPPAEVDSSVMACTT